MQQVARVAIGTVQPGVDGEAVGWAIMAGLANLGLRVQHFVARACFSPRDGAEVITNQTTRHLDSWLLGIDGCRTLFQWGSSGSDLALLDGRFRSALAADELAGSDLETLCEWLDIPRIALVDGSKLHDCQLPERPQRLAGVLIDHVPVADRFRLQTCLEALWGAPVIGFINPDPQSRAMVSLLPADATPTPELCQSLAAQLLDLDTIKRLAKIASSCECTWQASVIGGAAVETERPLRIAMAYDDAFHCYFPDALDQLELLGAELLDFSPLRDDRLPPDVDLVYFGCGHPEMFAERLAENCCMAAAIKRFVATGGRLYAECGGLAYLCRHIHLPDETCLPMAGVLPLAATMRAGMLPPTPVELTLTNNCWLGAVDATLRGYRTHRWHFVPLESTVADLAHHHGTRRDALAYHHAIGSRLHLNFAMQPALLAHIFAPHVYQPATATTGRYA